MDSLFNVGDEVIIKDKYDPGMGYLDYPIGFTPNMLLNFGGKTCKITTVTNIKEFGLDYTDKPMFNGDFYLYFIEGNVYYWHSSMFKPKPHEGLISIF